MNNGHRTIAAMLTVVAVLLTMNVLVMGTRRAEAGKATDVIDEVLAAFDATKLGDGDPYVVRWLTRGNVGFFRVWSDGQVDHQEVGSQCAYKEFRVLYPPVEHPFPVVDANGGDSGGMMVMYADGRVDYLINPPDKSRERCTISGDGSPAFCLGDVDRNGETGFDDLLILLNDWGTCEG